MEPSKPSECEWCEKAIIPADNGHITMRMCHADGRSETLFFCDQKCEGLFIRQDNLMGRLLDGEFASPMVADLILPD